MTSPEVQGIITRVRAARSWRQGREGENERSRTQRAVAASRDTATLTQVSERERLSPRKRKRLRHKQDFESRTYRQRVREREGGGEKKRAGGIQTPVSHIQCFPNEIHRNLSSATNPVSTDRPLLWRLVEVLQSHNPPSSPPPSLCTRAVVVSGLVVSTGGVRRGDGSVTLAGVGLCDTHFTFYFRRNFHSFPVFSTIVFLSSKHLEGDFVRIDF